jgi:hypothetical protein
MATKKLGMKSAGIDPKIPKLSKYLAPKPGVPRISVPNEVSWIMEIDKWPMFLNDVVSDDVVAAAGHMIQQWTYYANPPGIVPTDQQILKAYEDTSGYVPGNESTDVGTDMLTVLKYWKTSGIAGHNIAGYVALTDPIEIKAAIYLFGNAFVGLNLPNSALTQINNNQSWTVTDGGIYTSAATPGSWGGHAVACMAASPLSVTCITWGQRQKISWNFLHDYTAVAYAVVSNDWIQKNGKTLAGFDFATLQADLAGF